MKTYIYAILIILIFSPQIYSQCNIQDCPTCNKMIQSSLPKTNVYRGQVINELNGEPATFAKISLFNQSKNYIALADIEGMFSFTQIPDGLYDVSVTLIGFEPYTKRLSIRNGIITDKIALEEVPTCVCMVPPIIEPIQDGAITNDPGVETTFANDREQPTAGYEGHNFIEDPAIVYPNPASDFFNLRSTDPITVIEILNITGEVAVDKIMPVNNSVDISNLPAGQYFIRIYFENRKDVQIERMIVVR